MFGVRENPKIRPQIRNVIALKSAHLDRAYHVISKKANLFAFLVTTFASQSILRVEFGRFGSGDQLGSSQFMQAASMCVIGYGPLTDYKWSQWRPQIRKKVDRISKFGPSNPQKRYTDLTNFGPQIRKITDTNHQELPGA